MPHDLYTRRTTHPQKRVFRDFSDVSGQNFYYTPLGGEDKKGEIVAMATREEGSPLRSFLSQLRVAPHHAAALESNKLTLPQLASLSESDWADLPLPKGPLIRVRAAIQRGLWEHCVAEHANAIKANDGNGVNDVNGAARAGGVAAWTNPTTRYELVE